MPELNNIARARGPTEARPAANRAAVPALPHSARPNGTQEQMRRAAEAVAAGHMDKAIQHYKNALALASVSRRFA